MSAARADNCRRGIHVQEEVGHHCDAAVVVHVQEGHLAVRLA